MMPTLEQLLDEQDLQDSTKAAYKRAVRHFLGFAGASPAQWTAMAVYEWAQQLKVMVERGDLKAQTANQRLYGLKTASKVWCAFISRSPELGIAAIDFAGATPKLRRGKNPPAKKRALTYEQAEALVSSCSGNNPADLRDRAMVILGLHTGMRRISVAELQAGNIDWDRRTLKIMLKGGGWHKMPPLDEPAFSAIRPWRDWLAEQGIRGGQFFRRFTKRGVGDSLSVYGVHRALTARALLANIDGFSPHSLRHTFVTWMQDLRVPGYVISAYTGHKSDAMVLEYTDAWLTIQKQSHTALLPRALGGRS